MKIYSLGLRNALLLLSALCLFVALPIVHWPGVSPGEQDPDASAEPGFRTGNLQGVQVSIPNEYLFFPVEYVGESIWDPEADRSLQGPDKEISNFAIYIRWPSLEPRMESNDQSYRASLNLPGPHQWFRVGVQVDEPIPDQTPDNGLSRIITSYLNNPERYGLPEGVHFAISGYNEGLDLQLALPIGNVADRAATWNEALYWKGEVGQNVATLIMCGRGVLANPGAIHRCRHRFELPELNSDVAITYTADWLPQWKTIESNIKVLLLSFRTSQ